MEDQQSIFKMMMQKTQKYNGQDRHQADVTSTESGIRRPTDSHMSQEKKGATWNSYIVEAGERIEAVRCCSDGGVSGACTDKIKNRVGSAHVIQLAGKLRKTCTR